jgi:hypothetical protein
MIPVKSKGHLRCPVYCPLCVIMFHKMSRHNARAIFIVDERSHFIPVVFGDFWAKIECVIRYHEDLCKQGFFTHPLKKMLAPGKLHFQFEWAFCERYLLRSKPAKNGDHDYPQVSLAYPLVSLDQ